ncbi:methyl-accepting chemotaxis sensory transducer with Cache sensor [Gracilibacillus ureilyticus]|uniref:Methyl-accepting chemotaxis sensory transducer with Cache sensor n=1 Tax=Gracilibacillus ureilyticus TaxID=531814 RepID=A0A1H9U6F9_9BACI|nr:methyl-accepting chemotaxis protein [Gracilibacillus ureilyticus]SES05055.1 methyl-accepting chemotaxis sensory transducer with Cache sensor [Gracilibacillus ureilyticus]
MKKFNDLSIFWKIMVLVPFIALFLTILTFLSYQNASAELNKAINEQMDAKLSQTTEQITKELTTHEQNLLTTKAMLQSQDSNMTREQFESYFKGLLPINEASYGIGVWYEPYGHNEDEEYFGPYVYKDGDNLVYTDEYEEPSYDYPSIDWYISGLEAESPIWTTPYYDDTLDQTFITTALAFYDNSNQKQGVITSDYVLDSIQSIISAIQVEETGYAVLIDENGNLLSYPEKEEVLNTKLAEVMNEQESVTSLLENDKGNMLSEVNGKKYEIHYQALPNVGWKVLLFAPTDELYASLPHLLQQLIIISVVLIILIVLIVFFIGRSLSKSTKELNGHLEILATGDLTNRSNSVSKDEIGQMSRYLNNSVQSLQNMLKSIEDNISHVASTSEQLSASSEEINSSVDEVANSIQEVADNATSQHDISSKLSASSANMHHRLEKMAKSFESMNKDADDTTHIAEDGSKIVKEVVDTIRELEQQIRASSQKIYELDKKSDKIGEMAKLITDITEQTNLLALNAAIEAARAGESGKGFSVVAEEVRKLAEQTGQASKEINDMTNDIQQVVSQSVTMMEQSQHIATEGIQSVETSGKSFESITASIYSLSSKMNELTNDMTTNLSEMKSVHDLSAEVQDYSSNTSNHAVNVSATTEEQVSMMAEIARAAESLSVMAQELQEEMAKFKI